MYRFENHEKRHCAVNINLVLWQVLCRRGLITADVLKVDNAMATRSAATDRYKARGV